MGYTLCLFFKPGNSNKDVYFKDSFNQLIFSAWWFGWDVVSGALGVAPACVSFPLCPQLLAQSYVYSWCSMDIFWKINQRIK